MRTATSLLVALLLLAGCSSPRPEATVVVYAAASLEEVFTTLGRDFEAGHPGVRVKFSFEGSATLADQLEAGATPDVVATADPATMAKLRSDGLVAPAHHLTSNTLTLVIPPDNPGGITGLDSSLDGSKLVICAPEVPCGAATHTLAMLNYVVLKPVSEESKVTDVLAKVESGQADAGIVYTTDANRAGDSVVRLAIPYADRVRNEYRIALTSATQQPEVAARFVVFLESLEARQVMADAGFGP